MTAVAVAVAALAVVVRGGAGVMIVKHSASLISSTNNGAGCNIKLNQ